MNKTKAWFSSQSYFTTSGQETEWVYSQKPGASIGLLHQTNCLIQNKKITNLLSTSVERASPSTSSAMMTSGLRWLLASSRAGITDWTLDIFFSLNRTRASWNSHLAPVKTHQWWLIVYNSLYNTNIVHPPRKDYSRLGIALVNFAALRRLVANAYEHTTSCHLRPDMKLCTGCQFDRELCLRS